MYLPERASLTINCWKSCGRLALLRATVFLVAYNTRSTPFPISFFASVTSLSILCLWNSKYAFCKNFMSIFLLFFPSKGFFSMVKSIVMIYRKTGHKRIYRSYVGVPTSHIYLLERINVIEAHFMIFKNSPQVESLKEPPERNSRLFIQKTVLMLFILSTWIFPSDWWSESLFIIKNLDGDFFIETRESFSYL